MVTIKIINQSGFQEIIFLAISDKFCCFSLEKIKGTSTILNDVGITQAVGALVQI